MTDLVCYLLVRRPSRGAAGRWRASFPRDSAARIVASLLVLGALLLLPAPGLAAVARVQVDWDEQAASSATLVYTSTGKTTTTGNLIEGMVAWSDDAQSVSSIVDDKGNTYTVVDDVTANGQRGVSFYKENITGGADPQFTVTFSGAVTNRTFGYRELSGAATTGALVANDAQAQLNPGTGTDAVTSTAQTPSANDAWVSGWSAGVGIDMTQGTGFSVDADIGFPVSEVIAAEHLIQTTAASVAATFTNAEGANATTLTFMMAFKPAGAAAPCRPGSLSLMGVGC
jgi:hypothetical protein